MPSLLRPHQRTGKNTPPMTDLMTRGAPELDMDGLETCDGTPIKWDSWDIGTFAMLGQMVYNDLISNPPLLGDLIMQAWNKELCTTCKKAMIWWVHVPPDGGTAGR
jgi:hypothetical protein